MKNPQLNHQKTITYLVSFTGLILIAASVFFGQQYLGIDDAEIAKTFEALSDSIWGLPFTIVMFCAAAFIGAPQWMLITGSVLAFGPVQGGIYAWVATSISATLDFWIARKIGADKLERMNGELLTKITQAIRKNGFVTSFAVRLVPTGPFILVNFAAGLSNMKFTAFLLGTMLGIIPKIMVVVLIGLGVMSGVNKSYMAILFTCLAIVVIGITYIAQKRLKSRT